MRKPKGNLYTHSGSVRLLAVAHMSLDDAETILLKFSFIMWIKETKRRHKSKFGSVENCSTLDKPKAVIFWSPAFGFVTRLNHD